MGYNYSSNECDLGTVVLPPQITQLPRISREIFRRIAQRVLNVTSTLIGTQLTRESSFLESTLNASLGYDAGEVSWAFEYYHDTEEFVGLVSDTVVGSVTLPAGDRYDVELRVGATQADVTGTIAFAGVTFFGYFGGGT
jgi:hypothetical protein